jgi:hypothetical protein
MLRKSAAGVSERKTALGVDDHDALARTLECISKP